MNYPLKSSYRSADKKRRSKAIIIIVAIFVSFLIFRADLAKGFVNKIAFPFWKIGNYTTSKFSNFSSIISSKKSLIIKNRRLEDELSKAKLGLLMQAIIAKENEDLKALLGRNDAKRKVILGVVLKRPSLTPFDVLIIDVGKNKGVKKGDKVLYKDTIVIGQVEEVFDLSSKVKLYSSPGEKITAFIGSKSIQIDADGLGGGNFLAKLPKGAEINEGDAVVIPNISSAVLGFVEKIEANPADSFQKIIFKTPFNLSEINLVEVEIE